MQALLFVAPLRAWPWHRTVIRGSRITPVCLCRHVDPLAKDLIRRLLTADKTKRLGCLRGGAEDIKAHKWFDRLNWDSVLRCTYPVPFTPKVCVKSSLL